MIARRVRAGDAINRREGSKVGWEIHAVRLRENLQGCRGEQHGVTAHDRSSLAWTAPRENRSTSHSRPETVLAGITPVKSLFSELDRNGAALQTGAPSPRLLARVN